MNIVIITNISKVPSIATISKLNFINYNVLIPVFLGSAFTVFNTNTTISES